VNRRTRTIDSEDERRAATGRLFDHYLHRAYAAALVGMQAAPHPGQLVSQLAGTRRYPVGQHDRPPASPISVKNFLGMPNNDSVLLHYSLFLIIRKGYGAAGILYGRSAIGYVGSWFGGPREWTVRTPGFPLCCHGSWLDASFPRVQPALD
jgi:hypothetical protein